jgi:hypothetical protein
MIQSLLNNPFLIFFIAVLIIAIPLFIFPINLFDGVIIMKNGLSETKIDAPLSLSYFIGLGYNSQDMEGIKDFYLLPKGYLLAFCIILGCPAIVTYRIFLAQKKKKKGK